jgi:hypothetical protein
LSDVTDSDFETGEYDVGDFAHELEGEHNHDIGTKVLLENDRVRVWEIRLEPGDRVPFHWHTRTYFFVCVDGGRARTRFANGTWFTGDMASGFTYYSVLSEDAPEVHDLENVGDTTIRYTTVELLDA